MVAFMHTGTRLTAGYRYTTLGDATDENHNHACQPAVIEAGLVKTIASASALPALKTALFQDTGKAISSSAKEAQLHS